MKGAQIMATENELIGSGRNTGKDYIMEVYRRKKSTNVKHQAKKTHVWRQEAIWGIEPEFVVI